jgi:glycosyltransferase involved in cell wall biosynthesis
VVVQGGIALSSLGILAGRLAGVRTINYLPMTHDESVFSPAPWRAKLRQLVVNPLYSLPHCLVTISPRMAAYALRRRNAMVRVVENGIVLPLLTPESRSGLRTAMGLAEDERLLLMVGRIEFWQKCHDIAAQSLALARSRGARVHLLVVGAGPDEQALRAQVTALGIAGIVHWRAWQDDMGPFYAACDVLLLPSRYEGVPLVMLEAMYAGRKIIASAVDGMADMLPQAWTFAPGDVNALADQICASESPLDIACIARNRHTVETKHTIDAFESRFQRVIEEQFELTARAG